MAGTLLTDFPRLPAEIRLQIWRLALAPEAPGEVVFCIKKRCWVPRRLAATDSDFDPVRDDGNLTLEFRHKLLEKADFYVPRFSVSRESRSVTWPYVASQNLQCRDSVSGLFQRRYDPARDVLLAPTTDALHVLLTESSERLFEPGLLMRGGDCPCPDTFRLAITQQVLAWLAAVSFGELWDQCLTLETLYMVENVPGSMQTRLAGRHWEIVAAHETAYVWDASARQMAWRGNHSIDGPLGRLFAQMESNTVGLPEKLVEPGRDRLGCVPCAQLGDILRTCLERKLTSAT